jgi:hypothetical protein
MSRSMPSRNDDIGVASLPPLLFISPYGPSRTKARVFGSANVKYGMRASSYREHTVHDA